MLTTRLAAAVAVILMPLGLVAPAASAAGGAAQPGQRSAATATEPGPRRPVAISCWASDGCGALDGVGHAVVEQSGTWGASMKLGSGGFEGWADISCTSGPFCVAVSHYDYATFDGTSWSPVQPLHHVNWTDSVSCVSPQSCIAVGENSTAAVFNGTTWKALGVKPAKSTDFTSISCWAVGSCVAATEHGDAIALVDGTWQQRVVLKSAPHAKSGVGVSCADSFCIAMQGPNWRSFDGSTWSGQQTIALAGAKTVSCQGATSCLATATSGKTDVFDGTSWTSAARGGPGVIDVSGPTSDGITELLRHGAVRTFDGSTWSKKTVVLRR